MPAKIALVVRLLTVGFLAGAAGCASRDHRPPATATAAPNGDGGRAVSTTEAADDRTAVQLFLRGLEWQRLGDATRAEQYLGAALARGYPMAKVFPALLDVCLASDRFDAALRYARVRLIRQPDDWSLRYLVATLELSAGHETLALPELRRLVDEKPERPEAHYLLAVLARDHLGNRGLALRSFNKYLHLDPAGTHASEAKAFLREMARAGATDDDIDVEREGTP